MSGSSSGRATEQSREAQLQARVQELEAAVQARDDLLAVAAHELRNPMHSLLLQVTVALQLAQRRGDEEIGQRLERIKHLVDRYVKRATVLLDACRFNSQQFPLDRERCDLAVIVEDAVDSFAAEAEFNKASVELLAPDSLVGRWDRLAVEQIFANLISNAIKYGAGGAVRVTLRRDGTAVHFEVTDHGVGIAADDQARIFGRFEQAVGAGNRRAGFGIGLWLVNSLVRAHGGTISVRSAPGAGATFIVQLPLMADD